MQEIVKIKEAAREVYDNMNENRQKYQDYSEDNEEIEIEMEEVQRFNNNLNISVLNQLTEVDHIQSEVTARKFTECFFNNSKINKYFLR